MRNMEINYPQFMAEKKGGDCGAGWRNMAVEKEIAMGGDGG
jgi:hypothetical protein